MDIDMILVMEEHMQVGVHIMQDNMLGLAQLLLLNLVQVHQIDGGAGAGNPGGIGYNGVQAGTGTGGLIILVVWGNLILNLNGKLLSQGTAGSAGTNKTTGCDRNNCYAGYGGCGSGGGSINIFYKGNFINYGMLSAAGGAAGAEGGKPGENGKISIMKF